MARVLGYALYRRGLADWACPDRAYRDTLGRPVQVRLGGLTLLARVQRWYQLQSQAP